jgi:RNA polymerase sigma-70 factor (ECF subfamily)
MVTVMNDMLVSPELGPADRSYMFAVVRRIIRDEEAAADATQDALLLAHRHRDQFRGDSAYRTWLYRIAVTTALGYLRKQRRSRESLAPGDQPVAWDVPDTRPGPDEVVSASELAAQLADALASVGDTQRRVFLLRLEDWSESEIARQVGISVANVKIRAHRARARIRAALPEHDARARAGQPAPVSRRRARSALLGRPGSPADSSATSPAS